MGDENGTVTPYVILRRRDDIGGGESFERVGAVTAHGGLAAIRQHVAAGDPEDAEGTYVAVPARSWKLHTLKTTTQTKQVWS